MSNERKYYEDIGYKPFLVYVIFGISGGQIEVSKSKHHVDGMPEGLDSISLERPMHSEYIDGIIGTIHINRLLDTRLFFFCLFCFHE